MLKKFWSTTRIYWDWCSQILGLLSRVASEGIRYEKEAGETVNKG